MSIALHDEAAAHDGIARLHAHRHALTREHRGIDAQRRAAQERAIGGDAVTGLQPEHVTGDDFHRVDGDRSIIADNGCSTRQEGSQSLGSAIGPTLLDEGEYAVDQDDARDGHGERGQPGKESECGRAPQHESEEVGELADELPQRRGPVRSWLRVGTDLSQDVGSLGRGQSGDHRHGASSRDRRPGREPPPG